MKCPWIAVGLVWVGGASAEPLTVRASAELPFSTSELDAALTLRTQLAKPGAHAIEANVTPSGDGVRVQVAGRERELPLDGARGVKAARLVAFAILDLAGDELDPPAIAHAPVEQVVRHEAPEEVAIDHAPRAAIAMWARSGSRNEAELELGIALVGPLRAIVAGGASTRDTLGGAIAVRSLPVRAGLAWRGPHVALGELEVRATAIALFEQASATIARTDPLIGGGASLAWAAPLFGDRAGATLLVGAGGDAFATQFDYRIAGMPIASTPRLTWWAGLAIAGELWR